MEFEDMPGKAVAGGSKALMADPAIRRVMSAFGDGCLDCYDVDIRRHRRFMSGEVLRSVRSFIAEYGEDDAVAIVKRAFGPKYDGRYRQSVFGTNIFTKRYRWLATQMLMESGGDY